MVKSIHASRSSEERSEIVRKGWEGLTAEQRSERGRKRAAGVLLHSTPEERRERAIKAAAKVSKEDKILRGRKGGLVARWAAAHRATTLEQRQELGRKGIASRMRNS